MMGKPVQCQPLLVHCSRHASLHENLLLAEQPPLLCPLHMVSHQKAVVHRDREEEEWLSLHSVLQKNQILHFFGME
jgi:hypothetical protein